MGRAAVTPETEKERRKKWILMIALLLSLAVLFVSIVFLARIKGWLGRGEGTTLLTVVNAEQAAPEDEDQTLAFIDDEYMLDLRCASELEELLRACRAAGYSPVITAAYRSASDQRELLNELADAYMAQGYDAESAKELAAKEIPLPGHSEHQLGLAVDLSSEGEDAAETGKMQDWLMENAWRYGFILRYPNGTTDITGIIYEPWHYRYVGERFAKDIYEKGVTLEEYIALRRGR